MSSKKIQGGQRGADKDRLLASTLLAGIASLGLPMAAGTVVTTLATDAMAQDYTTVVLDGRVEDADGAPISGAQVTVRSNDQSFVRSATTNADGRFDISGLPPGSYAVEIGGSGYQSYSDSSVPLRVGASSYNFTLARVGEEEIVVTAARSQSLEFNRTSTGIVVNTSELEGRIPLGRNVNAVMQLAPGASSGDNAFGNNTSLSGASVAENAFYVNGLNITNHRTLIGGSRIPFEFYDTVEVRTGGYQAEYGRATGGVVNAISKSGSNEFEFGVVAFAAPGSFQEETAHNTFGSLNEFDERSNSSATFYASGPILRDRLFFYGLYEMTDAYSSDTSNTSSSSTLIPSFPTQSVRTEDSDDSPFWAGKLDFNITNDHRIEYTVWSDEYETERRRSRVLATDNSFLQDFGGFTFTGGGVNQIARYTGDFTDWFSLSAAWGENVTEENIESEINPQRAVIDTTGGFTRVLSNYNTTQIFFNEDIREMLRVDADFRFNLLGEHHVRMGYDAEKISTDTETRANPSVPGCTLVNGVQTPLSLALVGPGNSPLNGQCLNMDFLQRNSTSTSGVGGPYPGGRWRYQFYQNIGYFESDQTAYYIQDSWDILPNLTLQLGVRSDSFENSNLNGETFITMEDQIAPRLGFSWDPTNDGRTKVYGSFGTYFLPVATNTNIRLGGSELFYRIAYRSNCANNPDGTPVLACFVYAGTQTFADGSVPTGTQATSSQLDPFQEDEYVLGIERYFGDWRLGLSYTHRELVNVIEDIAIDAVVNEICLAETAGATNCSASSQGGFSGFHQYVLSNPGGPVTVELKNPILGEATNRTITFDSSDINFPEVNRELDLVTFSFERPFDGTWGLQGNYTWMDSRGNYEGAVKSDVGQDDAGLTQDFDQPGLTDDASFGKLPNHREHTIRLFGTWSPWENFLIGANVLMQSPRRFGCIGVHPGAGPAGPEDFSQFYGAATFYCNNGTGNGGIPNNADPGGTGQVAVPRGSALESDWREQIDLSFIWNAPTGEGAPSVQLRFDIFNVMDNDAITDLNEVGDLPNGALSYFGQPGPYAVPSPTYGLATSYQAPRSYRAGIAVRF